jgi:membrane-associated phospholipid phosphatase
VDLTPAVDDRRLRPVDRLLLGYFGFTSAVALTRLSAQPAVGYVLAANALGATLPWLMRAPSARLGALGRGLREVYPLLLLPALYSALDVLNAFGGVPVHDALVRRWERFLFGSDLSRTWWQAAPSPFWSTVFHAAYLAYYPIIAAPLVCFLASRRPDAVRRAVGWIMPAFLLSYLVFLLFPVAGPYYEFPHPTGAFVANPMARTVYGMLSRASAYGAAFPSSHVAAALVAAAAAFRGSRALGWALVPPVILLTIGVVYCQMHYAVDVLGGVALAGLVVGAGLALEYRHPPVLARAVRAADGRPG